MKAKPIDRVALTREKFGAKMYGDNYHFGEVNEMMEAQHRQGYSVCPSCGLETLRHDGSCVMCENCSWSKCG